MGAPVYVRVWNNARVGDFLTMANRSKCPHCANEVLHLTELELFKLIIDILKEVHVTGAQTAQWLANRVRGDIALKMRVAIRRLVKRFAQGLAE